MDTFNLLGIKVNCVGKADILELVDEWAQQRQLRMVTYVNAHCANMACRDPEYRSFLTSADLTYADGVGVVWAGKFLANCQIEKVTGRDWIYDFCRLAEQKGLRIYILAGQPKIAQKASLALWENYPALQIVGASDGFFVYHNESDVLQEIAQCKPQVVFIGMGAGLQEKWMAQHRSQIAAPVCWSVGALFDFVAGVEPPVPAWMNHLALEWLWRLLVDPAGKWKRYILGIPVYISRVVFQKFSTKGKIAPRYLRS